VPLAPWPLVGFLVGFLELLLLPGEVGRLELLGAGVQIGVPPATLLEGPISRRGARVAGRGSRIPRRGSRIPRRGSHVARWGVPVLGGRLRVAVEGTGVAGADVGGVVLARTPTPPYERA